MLPSALPRRLPLCLALLLSLALPAAAREVTGRARIIDGDTLEIGSQVVRLLDIDAPETAQTCHDRPCGREATAYLQKLIRSRKVHCSGNETDRYGRLLARCDVGGADLGADMVLAGQAVAYRQYGLTYVDQEKVARIEGRGLWAGGAPVMPWDFRAGKWSQATTTQAKGASSGGNCPIKGNISAKGERIYHMPYSEHYAQTRIDTSKGERWFCTEAEALAAGWRAARR